MNRIIMNYLTLILLLFTSIQILAQSDREMFDSFKERYNNLASGIKSATSLDDLNNLTTEVENLKRDFSAKKEILDPSLYPENYNSSFEKLFSAIELRQGDFTSIDVLKTEVTTLKSEIDLLDKRNNELINQITVLESQRKKDASTVAKLEKLVSDLRTTILKRDELVFSIVDSLTPKLAGDVSTMTQQDKDQVYSQVEKNNILAIVKKSLRDNSRFLEVTSLKADDLENVKRQEQNFVTMWRKVGPKLVDVYANQKDKTAELKDIDNLFGIWSNRIRREAWESINEEFSLNNINLPAFNNGEEFTNVITQFISDEIKNYGVKSKEESEQVYSVFADSVWFSKITSEWMPYLIENKLLSTQQKDGIEKKIAEWKSTVSPQNLTWLYAVIGLAIVFIVILVIILRKKKPLKDVPPVQDKISN